ncbi:MAG: alpha-D-ribose 1-methylphosphonate 5-triphosphate diphosphatase, partial [Cyanobacteria bacterium J06629_18]
KRGLMTVFGAPNLLRGQSQSGSIKAIDAIKNQVADTLCADYSPNSSMLVILSGLSSSWLAI